LSNSNNTYIQNLATSAYVPRVGWFSDRDTEYFGTLRAAPLFCVSEQQGIMMVVKPKGAAAMLGIESVSSWKPGRVGDRN
jgi:hypothetical protein